MSAIVAKGLGKRYALGEAHAPFGGFRTLRDAIAGLGRGTRRRHERETIWAVRDVSFVVEPGEAVGVIGSNGAGKSTLLKILTRITEPTTGEAIVRGRVGSLLEVGTGFHPELTGRENIFLNGAILGMRKREIAGRFEEIVAFAGLEQFIDTPVKRYSTGMYVRLGFAVAAHLETEILLVDEVLSVGDFAFQRRCLGKMQEQTSAEGRTVLFVSHNLGAVKTLTERCLWLDGGTVRDFGPTEEVIREYVHSNREAVQGGVVDLSDLTSGRSRPDFAYEVSFDALEFRAPDGRTTDTHFDGEPISIRLRLRARRRVEDTNLQVFCRISSIEGVLLFSAAFGPHEVELEPGVFETGFTIDPNPLGEGAYVVELYMTTVSERQAERGQDLLRSAGVFYVEPNPAAQTEVLYVRHDKRGLLNLDPSWEALEPLNRTVTRAG
jgi:homopolymeric O-antigen transport system ATP-binding protein